MHYSQALRRTRRPAVSIPELPGSEDTRAAGDVRRAGRSRQQGDGNPGRGHSQSGQPGHIFRLSAPSGRIAHPDSRIQSGLLLGENQPTAGKLRNHLSYIVLQKIETPFLTAVQTTLGDRYTENVEGIYKLTIKFIIQTLVTGFEASDSTAYGGGGSSAASGSAATCPYSGSQS